MPVLTLNVSPCESYICKCQYKAYSNMYFHSYNNRGFCLRTMLVIIHLVPQGIRDKYLARSLQGVLLPI